MEITNCDVQKGKNGFEAETLGFYGARRGHALKCPRERQGY